MGNVLILPAFTAIDYEQAAQYNLTIAGATADGVSGAIDLVIPIGNQDDEAPVFESIPQNISVIAGTTTLSVSPLAIVASDSADGFASDEISYAFFDSQHSTRTQTLHEFTIDSATGVITVIRAPAYSPIPENNQRSLTIRATDQSPDAVGSTHSDAGIVIAIVPPANIVVASSAGANITVNESDDTFILATTISIETPGVLPANETPYAIDGDLP